MAGAAHAPRVARALAYRCRRGGRRRIRQRRGGTEGGGGRRRRGGGGRRPRRRPLGALVVAARRADRRLTPSAEPLAVWDGGERRRQAEGVRAGVASITQQQLVLCDELAAQPANRLLEVCHRGGGRHRGQPPARRRHPLERVADGGAQEEGALLRPQHVRRIPLARRGAREAAAVHAVGVRVQAAAVVVRRVDGLVRRVDSRRRWWSRRPL